MIRNVALALFLSLAACGLLDLGRGKPEQPAPIAEAGGEEWLKPAVDPRLREKHLAERFPGVRSLSHLKLMAWPNPRQGACWSELTRRDETRIEAKYALQDEKEIERRSGFQALEAAGWTRAYRSPNGEGIELRSSFRSVDLTFETELRCRCAPRTEIVEGDTRPLRLRFRWSTGQHPEVSARVGVGVGEGLRAVRTFGSLVTYEFPVRGEYPDDAPGACGAHLALTLQVEPPIL